uniref:GTP-binding protein GEM n=1 Tax=Steinernema glaseri TaxID=37863 RepID=A0A1I7YF46_9BILA
MFIPQAVVFGETVDSRAVTSFLMDDRRVSLPSLQLPHRYSGFPPQQQHFKSYNGSHFGRIMPRRCLLPELSELDAEPSSVFSLSSSSSAEVSPVMYRPSQRPHSDRTCRRRLMFAQETTWPSDDESTDSMWGPNGGIAEVQSFLHKSAPVKSQLRSYNVDKQGKITDCGFTDAPPENDDCQKDQEQRRATCPEIWLNSEEQSPQITKYILRLYGNDAVGKKTLAERLASQTYINSQDLFTSCDSIATRSRTISFVMNNNEVELEIIQGSALEVTTRSRTISFVMNNNEVELEIIQGSALESNPFQNVLTIYMVIYSIDSRDSFSRAAQTLYRINDTKRKGDDGPPIILVANKVDLQRKRRISFLEGKMLSKIYKCAFIEASAQLTVNVDTLWSEILRKMQRKEVEKRLRFVGKIVDGGRKFAKSCEEIVARIAAI